MSGQPHWLRAFNRAERAVGKPLESLFRTDRFTDVLVVTVRTQTAMYSVFERGSRAALHLCNLPARSDVKRLTRQVAALSAEVRTLTATLEEDRELQLSASGTPAGPRGTE